MEVKTKFKKLKVEVKKAWLLALRSGDYKQASQALKTISLDDIVAYCCLGVLCALGKGTWDDDWEVDSDYNLNLGYYPKGFSPIRQPRLQKVTPEMVGVGVGILAHFTKCDIGGDTCRPSCGQSLSTSEFSLDVQGT